MPLPGPALGLDFGERRIGIALSDPDRQIATGLTTLDRRKHPDVFSKLAEIIQREKVTDIVLGFPERTDGIVKPGGKTEIVLAFAEELKKKFSLPVHLEDESFTSSLASDSLRLRRAKRGKKRNFAAEKAEIDRVAACFILQDWLDRNSL